MSVDLTEYTTLLVFQFFIVFCRVGSAFVSMPGFGEIYVSPRTRLMFALALCVIVLPIARPYLPSEVPANTWGFLRIVLGEVMIGLFFGGIMRIIQGALHIAGMIIAFKSSLASAILFDATQGSQGSVFGNFLTLMGVTIFFTSELHHIVLMGIAQSYDLFTPNAPLMLGDMAELATHTMAQGFVVAFKISAPLIVIGTVVYVGLGIMGRLMPSMQVFFVVIPLQVMEAFLILALTLSAAMLWYVDYFKSILVLLFGG